MLSDYVKKLLKKYGMENCNPRDTPTEAYFVKQVRARILSNPRRESLGMENEYQEQWGEFAWLVKTGEGVCFFVGMGARFMRRSGLAEIGWLKHLSHLPDKERVIIPG